MVDKAVEEARRQAEAALQLLDQETADGIIAHVLNGTCPERHCPERSVQESVQGQYRGQAGEEHKTLVQGVRGVYAMLWAIFKMHGLRQNKASLKAGAQGMAMLLTIVHYAYALGIRRGRNDG